MELSKDSLYNKTFLLYLLLTVILSLYTIYIFIPSDHIYLGDDFFFHIQRLKSLANALSNRTFPHYIDSDSVSGYGYASKWFYSDFTLIPFGIIACFTNIILSYKIMLFTLTLTCGITTYFCIYRILKDKYAAFLGGILYTFCLYRIYDLFFRAAVAEVIAFTILPLVIYGFYEIAKGNYRKWYILSISFSLLLYSHLISSVLVAATLVLFCLISYKSFIQNPKRFYYLILSAIVCLFLTSYFLFPFIEQVLDNIFYFNKYRVYHLKDFTLSCSDFLKNLASGGVLNNRFMYPSVGLLLIIPQFLRLAIKKNKLSGSFLKYADTALILGILFTITCLDIFPGNLFPFSRMNLIQFPFRFFLISSFFFAFSGSYYISILSKNKIYKILVLLVVIVFSLLYNINYEATKLTEKEAFIAFYHEDVGTGEYYPIKFSTNYLAKKKNRVDCKNTSTKIHSLEKNDGITSFFVDTKKADTLEVPLIYYKGYSATLNGKAVKVSESPNGLIEIPIKKTGEVKVSFTGTFLQKYSIYLTLISFVLLIGYIFLFRTKINQ